jgi:hypothetical protein
MDAASEENGELLWVIKLFKQRELLFPEREGGARADVATALSSFEDEATRSIREEHLEEPGRWDVEVGLGPALFEVAGLAGATASYEGEGWTDSVDGFHLFLTELFGDETEDSDAPGAIFEARGCLL